MGQVGSLNPHVNTYTSTRTTDLHCARRLPHYLLWTVNDHWCALLSSIREPLLVVGRFHTTRYTERQVRATSVHAGSLVLVVPSTLWSS